MSATPTVLILSDGKAGHELPLVGVAEALRLPFEIRRVRPRPLFEWLAPFGPIDRRDRHDRPESPLRPPYPDICLASGRRTVPYLRSLKRLSPQTFTVYFKDPRTKRSGADLIVAQPHDNLKGPNILTVVTAPHRFSAERLAAVRRHPPPHLATLPKPRLAVLVGGNSRHHRFSRRDVATFLGGLEAACDEGAGLMVTLSRRTPPELAGAVGALAARDHVSLWKGAGENPFADYLALADAVVATADSINMVGEATASGKPLHIFWPTGGHRKFERFLAELSAVATVRSFPGEIGGDNYPPIDSTPQIAAAILKGHEDRLARMRSREGSVTI